VAEKSEKDRGPRKKPLKGPNQLYIPSHMPCNGAGLEGHKTMASKVSEIAENVKNTRKKMALFAARGWNWFVIRPDGTIHSKHRKETGTKSNINAHMLAQGFRVWHASSTQKGD
jgi:hypothetical protein